MVLDAAAQGLHQKAIGQIWKMHFAFASIAGKIQKNYPRSYGCAPSFLAPSVPLLAAGHQLAQRGSHHERLYHNGRKARLYDACQAEGLSIHRRLVRRSFRDDGGYKKKYIYIYI